MIIKSIKIANLKNIEEKKIQFSPSHNLIFGENGTGKTTVLEAIFILGFGKSFLNVKKRDLVRHGQKDFSITGLSGNKYCENKITAFFGDKFGLFLNGKKTTLFEINDYLYPVVFTSSNYNLYIENRPYIRKLIDRFVFGVDSLYLHYILGYNKALKQKNYLLKTKKNTAELSSWNKIISETAEQIVKKRMDFIEKLNTGVNDRFGVPLEVRYKPSLRCRDGVDRENFFTELEDLKSREIQYNKALKGPHLDDFKIFLNSRNLKFNSSGEKKLNLLMLYIAFFDLYKEGKNDYPLFLIDDFDTAMDSKNVAFLIENYPDLQVIATSVNKNRHFDNLLELKKEN